MCDALCVSVTGYVSSHPAWPRAGIPFPSSVAVLRFAPRCGCVPVFRAVLNEPSSPKKKHVCSICEREFTASGHLAHHKCPFPGCETHCSRQDNLHQQSVPYFLPYFFPVLIFLSKSYWIHLSPGSC